MVQSFVAQHSMARSVASIHSPPDSNETQVLDVEVIFVQMIDEGGGDANGCRFTKLHESTAEGHGDRRVLV